MKILEKNSNAVFEFTLEWSSNGVEHSDSLWADPVNLWRDVLVPGLAAGLDGKKEGEKATVHISKDASPLSHPRKKLATLRPAHFHPPYKVDEILHPSMGRFYPQGYLNGTSGVFPVSIAPARYIGHEHGQLLFDLNHPLSGKNLTLSSEIIEIRKDKAERGGRCEDWLEKVCADGPGMQARYQDQETKFFTPEALKRSDDSPDELFYREPRMVQHLDSTARETIRKQYGQLIAPDSRILDLMGSWDSHLPRDLSLERLTVLGMNEKEIEANTRATDRLITDLNQNPSLTFDSNSFDAIICTASVEYLTDPLSVFAELHRVLKPGGILALAFSNRWFPPKAIKIWSQLHEFERLAMVMEMFHKTSGFKGLTTLSRRGLPRPDDDPHWQFPYSDPVYMAWGRKK